MSAVVRIAMWSGPRNLSTALMRSFENRPDTAVVDEPFYAVYLDATGLDHPMRDDVLRSQSTDWRAVVAELAGPVPGGCDVFYQKHMTHHLLPEIDRGWTSQVRNAFLIRAPEDVLASYAAVRAAPSLEDIGVPQQRELFDREADRLGQAPPVVDSYDLRENPRGMLVALCEAVGIPFTDRMLGWPAGKRASDGVWAPTWYAAVERSTGFAPPRQGARPEDLPDALRRIAARARPSYERLAAHRLRASR